MLWYFQSEGILLLLIQYDVVQFNAIILAFLCWRKSVLDVFSAPTQHLQKHYWVKVQFQLVFLKEAFVLQLIKGNNCVHTVKNRSF